MGEKQVHLHENSLFPDGVAPENQQRRPLPGIFLLLNRRTDQPHHLRHNLRLQWEPVLWGAVRCVQMQNGSVLQGPELWAALEDLCVVSAVAAVQHRSVMGPFKDNHGRPGAVVGREERDRATRHLKRLSYIGCLDFCG